jgi:RHH-type proline utilization regulon transcriptional repressor/proline dehydrogenase/delta 1-pyrroline-5-carboxylate dehydrogenase
MKQPANALPNPWPPAFDTRQSQRSPLRQNIVATHKLSETEALHPLLAQMRIPADTDAATHQLALQLATTLRQQQHGKGQAGLVQGLLQEFSLSSDEGIALMCLAEALLRIPDAATQDALIRDKIRHGQWSQHLGHSGSLFVNAATWGLMLTGKLLAPAEHTLGSQLTQLLAKGGEPLIRKGMDTSMRMLGAQFVAGQTIAQALQHAQAPTAAGFRYSYDMLGEAALTAADANRYTTAYTDTIHAIGQASAGLGTYEGPGISIKLSALHPRYSRAQWGRVVHELYPRLLQLAQLAHSYQLGLNIDAEEADRLDISLDLVEMLCLEPSLQDWNGLGFVAQAYQKRCPAVVAYLIDLARRSRRRLMVRLVKGAYWDTEIKRTQIEGHSDYPVYTRKAHTDIAYLACARQLLAAPDAIYPQFATHNAHTVAAIYNMAGPERYAPGQYEFQCLHGMGESLYQQVVASTQTGGLARPCRIYAPVGTHQTLLAYLVRRLLENGANTSFVHRAADAAVPLDELVRSPIHEVDALTVTQSRPGMPHPHIALPKDLYGTQRGNAQGMDLSCNATLATLEAALQHSYQQTWAAGPMLGKDSASSALNGTKCAVINPAHQNDTLGHVQEASMADVEQALHCAQKTAPEWAATHPTIRAAALQRAADALEGNMPALAALLVREAGKTCASAISEVREAIDFLRYYAAQIGTHFDNTTYPPLGPVVCISPWNFPLAIFVGQVAAALAAGNTVLAKPAEQTPLIAAQAVSTLWQAGIPQGALQLLPGAGETIGAHLVADARVMGVLFTGSTAVARSIQKILAQRFDATGSPVTLIAETGGQNAMVVDSSALAEQVVQDALTSAFDSAGQRCSALRVLCVQEDVADHIAEMLKGAMAQLQLGNPAVLATDIGPVIDAAAHASITAHIKAMQLRGYRVFQACRSQEADIARGHFIPPTLIEIDHLQALQHEVFGPVLHFLRYPRSGFNRLLEDIEHTGYGLTLGLHTRINDTMAQVQAKACAGNVYINRNMVGAVVGVQPFGGQGLSGTGPKAGGPLYLLRLVGHYPSNAIQQALAFAAQASSANSMTSATTPAALQSLQQWATAQGHTNLANSCQQWAHHTVHGTTLTLPGPTGEHNSYRLLARSPVLCIAEQSADLLHQLAAVLATGGKALWLAHHAPNLAQLPSDVQSHISLLSTSLIEDAIDQNLLGVVLHHGGQDAAHRICQHLAQQKGPIVGLVHLAKGNNNIPPTRLLLERCISTNTAAAGGNAALLTNA